MSTILNILWNVPGLGFVAAFFWALAGCVMAITVIGLPWAKACFTLANYTLAPFGREVVSRRDVTGRWSLGAGGWGLLANIIWFLFVGSGLAAYSIAPVGKVVVPSQVAAAIDRERAADWLAGARRRQH